MTRSHNWLRYRMVWLALLLLGAGSVPAIAQIPASPTNQPGPDPTTRPTPVLPDTDIPPATTKPPRKIPPDEFPPNPLELQEPDPLLPSDYEQRSLNAAERKRLIPILDRLNAQASATLKMGDRIGAFALWNRELRLRRFLGPVQEVGRLNALLAQANDPNQQLGKNVNLTKAEVVARNTLLEVLGVAYQQVRLPQTAVGVYEQILTESRQRKDAAKVEATLITLGQLHLDWFDYPKAAETYQQLLEIARRKGDRPNEIVYLGQIAFIYDQSKQLEQGITYRQQAIAVYQRMNDPKPIPSLQIKIGDSYQQLGRLDLAEKYYQDAYKLSQTVTQLGYASEALQKLAVLYKANHRLDAALRVYNFLLGVEQQAYNYYGMMNAYDQIGQIYVGRKAYPQAIAAFQQGLKLATQLKFRQDYFAQQIQQVNQLSGK